MDNIIRQYVASEGITLTILAQRAGISKELLSYHLKERERDHKSWKPEIAQALERASDGKIKASDLVFPKENIG